MKIYSLPTITNIITCIGHPHPCCNLNGLIGYISIYGILLCTVRTSRQSTCKQMIVCQGLVYSPFGSTKQSATLWKNCNAQKKIIFTFLTFLWPHFKNVIWKIENSIFLNGTAIAIMSRKAKFRKWVKG